MQLESATTSERGYFDVIDGNENQRDDTATMIAAHADISTTPPSNVSFNHYGKSFQEKIAYGLLTDQQWAAQMTEVMLSSYFDTVCLQHVSESYFSHYSKYHAFPTIPILLEVLRHESETTDGIVFDQIVDFITRMRSQPPCVGDMKYVKESVLDFCKRQSIKAALETAVDMISDGKFEPVIDIMKKSISLGMPNTRGHDFFEDLDERFVRSNRHACPTGVPQLDAMDVLRGGLGRGELGTIVSNTGVGKSHFLVMLGANAMRNGMTVVHYTFELSDMSVGLRYDSNFCDIPSNEILDQRDHVKSCYERMDLGRLIIKEFPTGSASVITIKNHLEKLSLAGIVPNVILIDYADIMKSTHKYDSLRHELKLVYEELRNLSCETQMPVWTASQAHRDSAAADIVGMENMAESYGKAMVADVVLSLSRKPLEKVSGVGRLHVAKNRAGKDGLIFPVVLDTARSKIRVLDETVLTVDEVMSSGNNSDMKRVLAEKWKAVRASHILAGDNG